MTPTLVFYYFTAFSGGILILGSVAIALGAMYYLVLGSSGKPAKKDQED